MSRDPRRLDPEVYDTPTDVGPDVRLRWRISPPLPMVAREGNPAAPPVQFPPWIYQPSGAFILDLPQNLLLVNVVAGGALIITWPRVPQGATGVVRRIGVSTADVVNTRITTRINGNPVPPLNAHIGAVGTLENPTDIGSILVRSGEEFSLLLENLGAAAVNMNARTMGWWWQG